MLATPNYSISNSLISINSTCSSTSISTINPLITNTFLQSLHPISIDHCNQVVNFLLRMACQVGNVGVS